MRPPPAAASFGHSLESSAGSALNDQLKSPSPRIPYPFEAYEAKDSRDSSSISPGIAAAAGGSQTAVAAAGGSPLALAAAKGSPPAAGAGAGAAWGGPLGHRRRRPAANAQALGHWQAALVIVAWNMLPCHNLLVYATPSLDLASLLN